MVDDRAYLVNPELHHTFHVFGQVGNHGKETPVMAHRLGHKSPER